MKKIKRPLDASLPKTYRVYWVDGTFEDVSALDMFAMTSKPWYEQARKAGKTPPMTDAERFDSA